VSKQSTEGLLLEGKEHPLRLLQEIPLGEAEQAAVEDGITAHDNLLLKLADVPTPAGPTPRQIGTALVQITSLRSGFAAPSDNVVQANALSPEWRWETRSWKSLQAWYIDPLYRCSLEPLAVKLVPQDNDYPHPVNCIFSARLRSREDGIKGSPAESI